MNNSELVAVFPSTILEHFEGLPGFSDSEINLEQFRLSLYTCLSFRSRGEVEEDESWIQVIPYTYVYLTEYNKILVYRRASKGGDPRLAGKWSLGLGGHINPVDDAYERHNLLDTATDRELQEELVFASEPYRAPITKGFIYCDATPVDRVHLGVVRTVRYSGYFGDIRPNGNEIAEICWVPPESLKDYTYENWSQIIVDNILSK